MASTSPALLTSAVKASAVPPSDRMMAAVSSAAAPLRSTQSTCAPSRANVTAVALPLPQPGPIEPAPTTIAVLPLSRGIEVSLPSCSPDELLRYPGSSFCGFPDAARAHPGYGLPTGAHRRNIRANPKTENLRQRPALAIGAQPPLAGRT